MWWKKFCVPATSMSKVAKQAINSLWIALLKQWFLSVNLILSAIGLNHVSCSIYSVFISVNQLDLFQDDWRGETKWKEANVVSMYAAAWGSLDTDLYDSYFFFTIQQKKQFSWLPVCFSRWHSSWQTWNKAS